MKEGLLLVVSGPSGCGKGTVCREILKHNKNIEFSISATTRKPRRGEVDGKDYFFINSNKFRKMVNKDEFLEYASVHGNYYGTPKKFVFDKMKKGKDIILEIDVQGALQIKKVYPKGVYVFLLPPSMEELKNRIIKRGTETKKDILKRYKNASKELDYATEYDYLVVNDDVENAVDNIEAIIAAEKCKVERQKNILSKIVY